MAFFQCLSFFLAFRNLQLIGIQFHWSNWFKYIKVFPVVLGTIGIPGRIGRIASQYWTCLNKILVWCMAMYYTNEHQICILCACILYMYNYGNSFWYDWQFFNSTWNGCPLYYMRIIMELPSSLFLKGGLSLIGLINCQSYQNYFSELFIYNGTLNRDQFKDNVVFKRYKLISFHCRNWPTRFTFSLHGFERQRKLHSI